MKLRSCRLTVESLEDRDVPSNLAYGDFNRDGLLDMAAVTSPTTIVVSLANPDGSYTVSATLTAPKSQPISGVYVTDMNSDGILDVYAGGSNSNRMYSHTWLGLGDGTFGHRQTKTGRFGDGF
jgi:hypothetical protein